MSGIEWDDHVAVAIDALLGSEDTNADAKWGALTGAADSPWL